MEVYTQLAESLASDGVVCTMQNPGRMVISRQTGPVWPDRGNSFWVIHSADGWKLFTWSPLGYRVPDASDMTALCRACMAYGTSAMAVVPRPIIEEFGLVELSEGETEEVFRRMK